MNIVQNPKCGSCKSYWIPDENDVKSSGLVYKCCKKCKEYNKKYREKNPDKIKEKKKKYREENTDKYKEQRKKYREENAGHIKEYSKKYREKNKCEHDKRYGHCKICDKYLYLINLQRCQISRCLKNSNLEKTKPSISYLDCSAEYFVEYFDKKMEIWNEYHDVKMNWDNIHTDHIKPINAFDLDDEEEFLKCCHYSNMQPLLSQDNLTKNCKWTDEDDMYWNDYIIYKEYFDAYIPV